ncbi:MAG: tetratricopeptide repeat protein [bacterium]|nr:tetratricopeptide repeat protein [bacterium]
MIFWQTAVSASPNLPKAHIGLGSAYQVRKDALNAVKHYKKALDLSPREWNVNRNLGILFMDAGNIDEAEKAFKNELSANPASAESLIELGVIYYGHKKEFERGGILWQEALKLRPNDGRLHEYLAAYYYDQKNDREKTIHHIKEAIRIQGTTQKAFMNILESYGINT